jgi:hypothetical protein
MLRYISLILVFCSSQLRAQNSFLIKGSFKDYSGVIYLEYNDRKDSCMVSGGAFEFKGDIDLPTPAFLLINDSKDVWFDELILEPAELTVKVDTLTKLYDGKPICKVNMTHLKGGDTNSLLKSFYNIIDKKRSVMEGKSFPETIS